MVLKVLFADSVYQQVLAAAHDRNPTLAEASWRDRTRAYLSYRFGCWDSWSRACRALGADADELILDRSGALAEATAHDEWDAVVLRHPHLDIADRGAFGRAQLRVCMVTSDAAAWDWVEQLYAGPRLMVTSFPQYAEVWAETRYLPLAFDARLVDPDPKRDYLGTLPWAARDIPVAFVGSLGYGQWPQAVMALSRVAETVPEFRWWGSKIGDVGEHLVRTYQGEAWGDAYWSILGRTKILANRHGAINLVATCPRLGCEPGGNPGWEAANMRLYEATGMGCLMLTEDAHNLHDLFEPWDQCGVYANPEDLARLVRHYLRWQDRAEEIARAGRDKTLRAHRYEDRAAKLLGWIEEALG